MNIVLYNSVTINLLIAALVHVINAADWDYTGKAQRHSKGPTNFCWFCIIITFYVSHYINSLVRTTTITFFHSVNSKDIAIESVYVRPDFKTWATAPARLTAKLPECERVYYVVQRNDTTKLGVTYITSSFCTYLTYLPM